MLQSKRFSIWRRLGLRFLLEDQPPAGAGAQVFTQILPVTQADDLLKVPQVEAGSEDLSGSGYVAYFTVPSGERWVILRYRFAGSTGTTGMQVVISGERVQIGDNTNTAASENVNIPLDEGDSIGLASTGNGSDTAIVFNVLRSKEDAY